MSIPVTIQSVPITVTVQDQAPIVVTISNAGTINSTPSGKGSSLLDFGPFPGSYSASIFIMTSAITANSFPEVNWVYSAQGNYSADEIALIASLTTLIVSDVTPGSGFTIYARSNELIQGEIPVRWQWD